jgi:hypothetical protein
MWIFINTYNLMFHFQLLQVPYEWAKKIHSVGNKTCVCGISKYSVYKNSFQHYTSHNNGQKPLIH